MLVEKVKNLLLDNKLELPLLESEVIMAGWKDACVHVRMLESESCSKSLQVDVPTKGWGLGGGVH